MTKLSKRLNKVLELINKCDTLADIGCDHGYICIEAVNRGLCKKAYACDTAAGPLSAAKKNIAEAGLSDKVECVLSDGFKAFGADMLPDCVNITGMGGRLIVKILSEAAKEKKGLSNVRQLITGGQSDLDTLREYLVNMPGMYISSEYCIFDDGKYYFLADVRRAAEYINKSDAEHVRKNEYTQADYLLGRNIAEETADTYRDYLEYQRKKLLKAISEAEKGSSQSGEAKLAELGRKLSMVNSRIAGKE